MTEVFERTVSLCPPLLGVALRWSSGLLLPGAPPPTHHPKPQLPLGRHHLGRVRSWLFPIQGNTSSQSLSSRNRSEHGVSQWLVLVPTRSVSSRKAVKVGPQNASGNPRHSVSPGPVFLHTNRLHVHPAAPEVCPSCWCHSCIGHKETKPTLVLSGMMESLRLVRHHAGVHHYSWCPRANSTVANRGSTKENASPSCVTSMSSVSRNSRNSSDLKPPSASRSTFRCSTSPQR